MIVQLMRSGFSFHHDTSIIPVGMISLGHSSKRRPMIMALNRCLIQEKPGNLHIGMKMILLILQIHLL